MQDSQSKRDGQRDEHMDGCAKPTSQSKVEVRGAIRRSSPNVRILTVDDNHAFRLVLRDLINVVPGFVLIGQACSGEEAIRAVGSLSPELVLMDVVMPGIGGIAASRAILEQHPRTVVVLISVDDPALYPGTDDLADSVAFVRKQDLCPHQLTQAWDMHHN